jgi:hypothetical protein
MATTSVARATRMSTACDFEPTSHRITTPSGSQITTAPQHVVFTRSTDGTIRGYVDGVLTSLDNDLIPGMTSSWPADHVVSVGNNPGGGRRLDGILFLVAFYDRALTDVEVMEHFLAAY